MSERNMTFAQENYMKGYSAEWIAFRLNLTKNQVCGFVRRNNIVRDGVVPRFTGQVLRPKNKDLWDGTVAPPWRSEEADRLLRWFWDANVLTSDMVAFFDITDDQLRLRRNQLGLPLRGPSQVHAGTGPMRWGSGEADTELRMRWDRGDRKTEILAFFGVGMGAFQARRAFLQLAHRIPPAVVERRQATKAIPIEERPKKPEPQQTNRLLGRANGKPAVFSSSGINWSVVRAAKVEYMPGLCPWPLNCEEPAVGRWCAEHSGLLGKKVA